MIDKYDNKFNEMHKEIFNSRNPLKVMRKYIPLFGGEVTGILKLTHYLTEHVTQNQ